MPKIVLHLDSTDGRTCPLCNVEQPTVTDLTIHLYDHHKCDREMCKMLMGEGGQQNTQPQPKVNKRPAVDESEATPQKKPRTVDDVKTALIVESDVKHEMALEAESATYTEDYYAQRPFRCDHCPKAYLRQRSLKWHLQRVHSVKEEKNTTVDRSNEDGDVGDTTSDQSMEETTAEYYDTRPERCDYCAKAYPHEAGLKRHLSNAHGMELVKRDEWLEPTYYDGRPCRCPHCPKAYAHHDGLRRHTIAVHSVPLPPKQTIYDDAYYEDRPHRCTMCEKGFMNVHSRDRHAYVPYPEKQVEYDAEYYSTRPERCPHCPKAFPAHEGLRRHSVSVHNAHQPSTIFDDEYYSTRDRRCPSCPKAYASFEGLLKHSRIMHDVVLPRPPRKSKGDEYYVDRPSRCTKCPSAFKDAPKLKWHMKAKHGLKSVARRSASAASSLPPPPTPPAEEQFTSDYYVKRRFHCSHCPKAFFSSVQHAKHSARLHADEEYAAPIVYKPRRSHGTREQCVDCPALLKDHAALRRHSRLAHNVETPKRLMLDALPVGHVLSAEFYDAHPHRCPLCPRGYIDGETLKRHTLRAHTDEGADEARVDGQLEEELN